MSGRRDRARAPQWEYRTVTVPRSVSRADYRHYLVDAADTGQWEVRRVLVFRDGRRKVTLRRRAVSVAVSF